MRMQRRNSTLKMLAVLLLGVLVAPVASQAALVPVILGTTSTFAVLAGSTITNTGPTTITGDVGLHPGTAFTGQASLTLDGELHLADAVAEQAKLDLIAAYNDAAGRTPVTRIATELGGTTLKPGVYDSESGTFQITGTLTLDAEGDPDGVFIFLTESTLITASDSRVNIINSARFCRIFWQVGSSATLGTNSHLVGHVLAMASITANTGASVEGQLLARDGAVTLDTNTITNGFCAAAQDAAINIEKSASPTSMTVPGLCTYTYVVTSPGAAPLGDIEVTDNKIALLTYVSGDVNDDGLLQTTETWIYTGTADLATTTTNIATVTGTGNGLTLTDTASVTVPVTPPDDDTPTPPDDDTPPPSDEDTPTPLDSTAPLTTSDEGTPTTPGTSSTGTGNAETVAGGALPITGTPWYNLMLVGVGLTFTGTVGLWRSTRRA